MNIRFNNSELPKRRSERTSAFFNLAFRPLFLLGAIFAMLSIIIWALVFQGVLNLRLFGGGLWWHIHEMLFGFVIAVVVGFLLTAVQTWTKVTSLNGVKLLALVTLWCFARIAMLFPENFPAWLIHLVDLAFLPIAIYYLAKPIIKVKLWRNLIFIPLLVTMALMNGAMHYSVFYPESNLIAYASNSMVILMALLMSIIGGRVFPMFSANGTHTKQVKPLRWLETSAIGIVAIIALVKLTFLPVSEFVTAWLFIIAAILHGLRALRWRIWVTWKTPLVWSLHLSYWAMVLGFLLFGLDYWLDNISHSQANHSITVGAMGMMILAMISRVSLGHTGRKLQVGPMMTIAFATLFLAFIVRVFGNYWLDNYLDVITISSILWCIGFGCFVAIYTPILTKPRIDEM